KSVEIVRHRSESGGILRFAILNLDNGFTVTGRPSVAASPENDNDEVGVKIAVQNAVFELWPFLGFKLVQQRHEQQS
uniref:Gp49 family protein n=2 Tax=Marinobacterium litorale TaxID=404770 RepID=UPI000488E022